MIAKSLRILYVYIKGSSAPAAAMAGGTVLHREPKMRGQGEGGMAPLRPSPGRGILPMGTGLCPEFLGLSNHSNWRQVITLKPKYQFALYSQ